MSSTSERLDKIHKELTSKYLNKPSTSSSSSSRSSSSASSPNFTSSNPFNPSLNISPSKTSSNSKQPNMSYVGGGTAYASPTGQITRTTSNRANMSLATGGTGYASPTGQITRVTQPTAQEQALLQQQVQSQQESQQPGIVGTIQREQQGIMPQVSSAQPSYTQDLGPIDKATLGIAQAVNKIPGLGFIKDAKLNQLRRKEIMDNPSLTTFQGLQEIQKQQIPLPPILLSGNTFRTNSINLATKQQAALNAAKPAMKQIQNFKTVGEQLIANNKTPLSTRGISLLKNALKYGGGAIGAGALMTLTYGGLRGVEESITGEERSAEFEQTLSEVPGIIANLEINGLTEEANELRQGYGELKDSLKQFDRYDIPVWGEGAYKRRVTDLAALAEEYDSQIKIIDNEEIEEKKRIDGLLATNPGALNDDELHVAAVKDPAGPAGKEYHDRLQDKEKLEQQQKQEKERLEEQQKQQEALNNQNRLINKMTTMSDEQIINDPEILSAVNNPINQGSLLVQLYQESLNNVQKQRQQDEQRQYNEYLKQEQRAFNAQQLAEQRAYESGIPTPVNDPGTTLGFGLLRTGGATRLVKKGTDQEQEFITNPDEASNLIFGLAFDKLTSEQQQTLNGLIGK